jgi:hypothetical protein
MKATSIKVILTLLLINIFTCTSEEELKQSILSHFINGPKKELFKVYHHLYQKEYNLNSQEGIERYQAFRENLNKGNVIDSLSDTKKCIQIYTKCGIENEPKDICETTPLHSNVSYPFKGLGLGGNKVVLFDDYYCTGIEQLVTSDIPCTKKTAYEFMERSLRSILILNEKPIGENCIAFYTDFCFSGERKEYCGDVADLMEFNGMAKAVEFGKNVKSVSLFSGKGFTNHISIVKSTTYSFYNSIMKGLIKSVRIELK